MKQEIENIRYEVYKLVTRLEHVGPKTTAQAQVKETIKSHLKAAAVDLSYLETLQEFDND